MQSKYNASLKCGCSNLVLILLASCVTTAKVRVSSTPIQDMGEHGSYEFAFLPDQEDVKNTARAREVAIECAHFLASRGFKVSPTVWNAKDPSIRLLARNEVRVLVGAKVLGGEEYGSGSTKRCSALGHTAVCRTENNSNILYKKPVILFFDQWDGKDLIEFHRIEILAVTPTESLSTKSAKEMCRVGLAKFPEKIDSQFFDTELTGDD